MKGVLVLARVLLILWLAVRTVSLAMVLPKGGEDDADGGDSVGAGDG
jgi:hypothetical protein